MARIDVVQTQLDVAQRGDVVVGATGTVTQAQDQIKKLISASNDALAVSVQQQIVAWRIGARGGVRVIVR